MVKKLIIFALIIIGIIAFLTLYLQPNDFYECDEQPSTTQGCGVADAVVVISGGDTTARTAAGIDLYQKGWAGFLVLSGAAQDKTGLSNAEAMKQQALAAGVPEAAIILDEYAETTQQNAEKTQTIFAERGFGEVILVTSGYHQRRASLEFTHSNSDVLIRNYPVQDSDWGWFWWATPRGWWLASSESAKIVVFYLRMLG